MWTQVIHTCSACGASWHAPRDEPHDCAVAAAREKALHDAFEALMAEEFGADGIWYVLPHWTTYKGAARFLASKFGIAPLGEPRGRS
jgi:hypothetical protein